jgi:hypothetical protein
MESITGVVVGAVVGGLASFMVARWTLTRDMKKRDYAHLDTLYQKILELYLLHPQFQDIEKTRNFKTAFGDKTHVYDAFATVIHNFLESIFDLAVENDAIDPQWDHIFNYHAKLHLRWLVSEARPFEREYCEFIRRKYRTLI